MITYRAFIHCDVPKRGSSFAGDVSSNPLIAKIMSEGKSINAGWLMDTGGHICPGCARDYPPKRQARTRKGAKR